MIGEVKGKKGGRGREEEDDGIWEEGDEREERKKKGRGEGMILKKNGRGSRGRAEGK